jgi:XTP/dITP diphosphohydrolase
VLARLDRAGYEPDRSFSESVDERSAAEREIGAALLALVRTARAAGVDAEGALRRTLRDIEAAVRATE